MKLIILLIPMIPLAGAVFNTFFGRKLEGQDGHHDETEGHGESHSHAKPLAGYLACTMVFISFVLSLVVFFKVMGGEKFNFDYFDWIVVEKLQITLGFLIDPLSGVMLLVVTGIGFLIHVYSLGYMEHDPDRPRFFTYLNLFIFSMLMLVMGNNLVVMFFGWEAVGLSSYLLIGYYYKKQSAGDAGKKAFIVNRVGDFGFGLGIFLIFTTFGTIHFETLFAAIEKADLYGLGTTMTAIGMLLFVGAMGKSAQIPLYTWLPDAMEGPTPVSALIHAATMVTAGVFMVARCHPIFDASSLIGPVGHIFGMSAGDLVTYVGLITALFAASIGFAQTDIKRVLAYSTVSQLGYMFIGVGVGAYAAGVFHLVTHAFFKALMFLGSGSVIHIMEHAYHKAGLHEDPQDMRGMGGLFSKAKVTGITFMIGWFAICGIPPFSGFFSKDEILTAAYQGGHTGVFWFGILGATMTAFYMSRLLFLTFFGESRTTVAAREHLHESTPLMTTPLVVLAIFALTAGFIGFPGHNWLGHFLSSAVGEHGEPVSEHGFSELTLMTISVMAGIVGIGSAFVLYMKKKEIPDKFVKDAPVLYNVVYHKYYVDEIYDKFIVNPIKWTSENVFLKLIDNKLIDGLIYTLAISLDLTGRILRFFQTGYVQTYAFFISLGVAAIIYYMMK